MARSKNSKRETRRGSPEAVAKRRAARALNSIFDKGPSTEAELDGRTLKRKRRLIKELQEGKGGEPLKAHEILTHATELFAMGENLASIRKLKPKLPPKPEISDATVAVIRDTQASYAFDKAAWKLIGVDLAAVLNGGAQDAGGTEAPKAKKRASKKKA
jgi:hypothetical protein